MMVITIHAHGSMRQTPPTPVEFLSQMALEKREPKNICDTIRYFRLLFAAHSPATTPYINNNNNNNNHDKDY